MAKRGDVAREVVKNTIAAAFKENFLGIQDKKIYVKAKDSSGEEIQFCIAITMPKTGFTTADATEVRNPNDWSAAEAVTPTEISAEDKAKVAELMKTLGIKD